jgi:hypothetical protein
MQSMYQSILQEIIVECENALEEEE